MDYGHELSFGSFITPVAQQPQNPVALAQMSEEAGLDLVTFQDHPYQPAFLDTWTLMSFVAAQTERIHISANVLNAPLRMPTLPRAAASLDLLSGGRFALGIGSGGFLEAIASMGGPALTPGESVTALEEAIAVIRATWDTDTAGKITTDGEHHHLRGGARGPRPAHDIPIWIGALGPRMLRLIGRMGDGWLPSEARLAPGALADGNARIDAAATRAGRDPREIRRLLNVAPESDATAWAERLATLTATTGVSTFIVASDDPDTLRMFGREVAPRVRELVEQSRTTAGVTVAPVRSAAALAARVSGIRYDELPPDVTAIEPGDSDYRRVRNTYLRGGSPGVVLLPTTTAEVSSAVRFAAAHPDVPLSIRSGGHGISGASTNDGGIVISLARMRSREVIDEGTRRVRIQSGATWSEVARFLDPHGWALSSGDSGGVGVGGIATAGGVGYLSRAHGLTIDHVVRAEMVLADGSVHIVDADHDPELFWGIRGAGGNLGIVTSFDFIADAVREVGFARVYFDLANVTDSLLAWDDASRLAPRDTTGFFTLVAQPGGRMIGVAHIVVDSDDPATVTDRLQRFESVGAVLHQEARMTTYAAIITESPQGEHNGSGHPVTRSALLGALDRGTAGAIEDLVRSGSSEMFQLRALGGAVGDVPADATAFPHRDAAYSAVAFGSSRERLDRSWAAVADRSVGLYTSFEASERPERIAEAFPEPTLGRLRALKDRVDPRRLFRDNFPVGEG